MSNMYKKVTAGDSFSFPARLYNQLVDVAKEQNNDTSINGSVALPDRSKDLILVKNSSGGDADQYGILGIDGPLFDPATEDIAFKDQIILDCITPAADHEDGSFVILNEPIADGMVGFACISGTCIAKVDILSPLRNNLWVIK